MADEEKIDFSLFINEYLNDAKDGFHRANNALLALEKDLGRTELLDDVARAFHTLKSSSAMLEFLEISDLAHFAEDLLGQLRKMEFPVTQEAIDTLFEVVDALEAMVKDRVEKKELSTEWRMRSAELKKKIAALGGDRTETGEQGMGVAEHTDAGDMAEVEVKITDAQIPRLPVSKALPKIEKIETVRVHMNILDSLFNLVGELMITKNRIDNILADTTSKELKASLSAMDHMITSMQDNVSAARLVPVDEIFQKFPRMVRDLAREQGKEIEFLMEGREIELDKAVLDAISEPLIHLLRNAIGHGIESAGERHKLGKDARGNVRLAAKRAENHIIIDVIDDGGGIDIERMKTVAVSKGFVKPEEAELLQDKDIMRLLFATGFSSVDEVTGLAGRGVGLNVVRTAAKEMGGIVEVASEKGKGSRFSMTLPLTTAIVQTLLVGIGDHVYAIPSDIVLETQRVELTDIKEIGGSEVFVRGEEVIPFVALNKALGIIRREDTEFIAVLIHRGTRLMGIGVDTVLDQTDNIVKPFDPIAQQFRGFSGGTILGDGRVALLLDIPTLFGFETLQEEKYVI